MNGRPKVEIGVYLINDSKNKILLGKNKFDAFWKLPSGRLKFSENWDECAQKHIDEQINLRISIERFIFLTSFNAIDKENKYHAIEIDFYVQITAEEEKELFDQLRNVYQGWEWFSYENIMILKQTEIFCGIQGLFKKNNLTSIEQIMSIVSN